MNIFSGYSGALHKIRVKLYKNKLPTSDEPYFARTVNNTFLTVEQICETMKKRTDSDGNYNQMVKIVKQFFDEMVFQLCDGLGVNLGYFSIYPKIGGTFRSIKDPHDREKNPIRFKFHARKALLDLAQHVIVDIVSLGGSDGFINKYFDTDGQSESLFVPGNIFSITGDKIKVAGDSPDCGVFFVSADDPSKAVKMARIAENTATKIIGVVPKTDFPQARIEVRTQYSSSGTLLKTPRVITSEFILEAA